MITFSTIPFLNLKILGRKIRDARLAKNLTQKDLAALVGSTESYISKIEQGACKCNLETLASICENLEISIVYTLDGTFIFERNYLRNELNLLFNKLSSKEKEKVYEFTTNLVKRHVAKKWKTKIFLK